MSQLGSFINRHIETLTKIGAVVVLGRSVLLLIDFPIVPIPYLDALLRSGWSLVHAALSDLSQNRYLPRF